MALTIPPEPKTYSPDIPPPGVRKDYVSFVSTRKIITPRLHLIHTNGAANQGSIEASKNWAERRTYNGTTTTLPTFQVDRDGDAAMFIPMNRAQNACYKVNGWAISCETADTGYKDDPTISAFTEPQLQVLANISAYASMLFKIPLSYPSTWDGSGTASHTEPFGYPYWTNSNGKICPGDKKKAQVREIILPWAREIVATWTSLPAPMPPTTPPTPPSEEEDVTDEDIERIAQRAAQLVWAQQVSVPQGGTKPYGWVVGQTYTLAGRAANAAETAANNTKP